jgi:hypothetical protein
MAFLEIFGLAHVYDDDIRFFRNQVAYFDGAGRESHFVREELLRLGRVALECFSHNDFLFQSGTLTFNQTGQIAEAITY